MDDLSALNLETTASELPEKINGNISDKLEDAKELEWAPSGGGGGGGVLPGMGATSPGGSVCSRPKTMKDFEEELMELRRDNFDLRMRIYLMEEQEDNGANITTLEQQQLSSKLPFSFAQIKELHLTNTQLKEEVQKLTEQLSEKEELVLQAAAAVETLEKNQQERLNQIKLDAKKECQKLEDAITQLTQELMESKTPIGKSEKSILFDDSNAMYAMAFGLPIPGHVLDPQRHEAEQKISALQIKLAQMESELLEESTRRIGYEEKLDCVKNDFKRSEEARRHLEDELKHREAELAKAHKLIEEKCQSVSELQDKLKTKFSKLSVDSIVSENSLLTKKDASKIAVLNSDIEDQLNLLQDQLKTHKLENIRLQGENMKAMRTIQGLVKHNKALTRDLEHHKSDQQATNKEEVAAEPTTFNKDNRISELEAEVNVLKEKLSVVSFGTTQENVATSDLSSLRLELESKNSEIDSLNEELKKRTFNLQELVNKELWDKNREIEKLNQTCDKKQSELNNLKQELNFKNNEVLKLQEELKFSVNDVGNLIMSNVEFKENKNPNSPLSLIIDEKLKIELQSTVSDNNKLKEEIVALNKNLSELASARSSLQEDSKMWKMTAEESEKNRKELINACTLLTTRLEELSTFLESLLPSLGNNKRRMLQQAIDRSREMSRSFSFIDQSNLSLSIPLLPDVSQVDFCSGDEVPTNTVDKLAPSENDEVTRLRNEVESLVEKLKKKDSSPEKNRGVKMVGVWPLEDVEERLDDVTEGSMLDSLSELSERNIKSPCERPSLSIVTHPAVEAPSTNPPQICFSESDGGWSEPDRNVSKERIGICDVTPQKPPNSSEESVRSNNKSSGKKARNEGLIELKRLSAKLDCLEQMNEALHTELQLLHRTNATRLVDNSVIINKPHSPKTLRDIVNIRRRSLEKSMGFSYDSDSKNPEYNMLSERIKVMSAQLENSCRRCLELEAEKKALEVKLGVYEDKCKSVENELEQTLSSLKEKDNYLLEKQCALLEANNHNILLNAKLETVTKNINVVQDQLEKCEKEISEKDDKAKELYKELDELKKQSETFEAELKSRLESCQREVEEAMARRLESEKRLIQSYEHQTELRSRLDQEIMKSKDMENQHKLEERSWRRRLSENEVLRAEREAELRRKLDSAVLTTSEAVLERTRLANDKLKLQQDLRAKETTHFSVIKELERRVFELETLNSELEAGQRCKWEVRQEPLGARSPPLPCSPSNNRSTTDLRNATEAARSGTSVGALSPPLSPSSPCFPKPPQRLISNPSSDYVSDQDNLFQVNPNTWGAASSRRNNCSPDLGIESDHHSLAAGKISGMDPSTLSAANGYGAKLMTENENLRKQLMKTRKTLADTLSQLTSANQKKRQVERAICKEIHKTHSVLQQARVNFEQNENQPPS